MANAISAAGHGAAGHATSHVSTPHPVTLVISSPKPAAKAASAASN